MRLCSGRVSLMLRSTCKIPEKIHRFFPGYKLPESVAISTDFAAAVAGAELLVVATPIAGLRPTVERLRH
jgi:glycerol-3-phosphate dehydrogenase